MEKDDVSKLLDGLRALIEKGSTQTVPPRKTPGERAVPLDMDSRRIFLRVSDDTFRIFTDEAEWLRDSGFRLGERRPKAQVLMHIMVHEWAKLSEEEKRKICSRYLD